ncbi:MAG: serine hydrolase, partial [Paraglaciecola sp.]
GWVKGYRADVAFSPEFGVGYVMLMNAESNLINEFTPDFWARCFEHLESLQLTAKNVD